MYVCYTKELCITFYASDDKYVEVLLRNLNQEKSLNTDTKNGTNSRYLLPNSVWCFYNFCYFSAVNDVRILLRNLDKNEFLFINYKSGTILQIPFF